MQADEILAIIEKFFEALKTVIGKLKEIFASITGGAAEEESSEEA